MTDPIALTTAQHFERELFSRRIDNTNDVGELQEMCKLLLELWYQQKAATTWAIRQQTNPQHSKLYNER